MTGVILAGGRSTRMGADKATVDLSGRAMIDWVAEALAQVCAEVVVAGREGPIRGLEAVPDVGDRHRGPLAGIAACAGRGAITVVAVDQPWVRPQTLQALMDLDGELPVVPVDRGARQATCAVYPAGLEAIMFEELDAGGSVQTLLDRVAFRAVADGEWRHWGEDGRSWFSADSPDELAAALARYGPPQPPM